MNTAEMISYTELLNKEKRIRRTWQNQTEVRRSPSALLVQPRALRSAP